MNCNQPHCCISLPPTGERGKLVAPVGGEGEVGDASARQLHGRHLEQDVEAGHQADGGAEVGAERGEMRRRRLQALQLVSKQVVLPVPVDKRVISSVHVPSDVICYNFTQRLSHSQF